MLPYERKISVLVQCESARDNGGVRTFFDRRWDNLSCDRKDSGSPEYIQPDRCDGEEIGPLDYLMVVCYSLACHSEGELFREMTAG